MGSKNRHAKDIIPFLLEGHNPDNWYIEPFVGGANVIDKINLPKRFGSDVNEYLIEMWKAVSDGWQAPKNFTEEQYNFTRSNKDVDRVLTGYVGFALSYAGKWFGGWRRDGKGERDYVKEAYNNATKQFPRLAEVNFVCKSVFDLNIPANSTIYCDPPYKGTTKYKDDFDHDRFYNWCRSMADRGCRVFVSEYWMPSDFICIWQKEVNNSLTQNTGGKKGVEKLYRLEPK